MISIKIFITTHESKYFSNLCVSEIILLFITMTPACVKPFVPEARHRGALGPLPCDILCLYNKLNPTRC